MKLDAEQVNEAIHQYLMLVYWYWQLLDLG